MKNIIKPFLLLFVLSGFLWSCEEFLEEKPITSFNEEQLFATADGAEAVLSGLYAKLSAGGYYGSSWHGLINPHSGRMFSNQTVTNDATSLNCSTENRWLTDLWPAMYSSIEQANIIIANMETSSFSNRDKVLGQAYLIRGLVYFDLVRLFGGVPLRTTPSNSENLHLPRASKNEVYNQVISDFQKAKALLPEAAYNFSRPRKWAAHVLLSKVYMQRAGEDGGNPAFWQNAWDEILPVFNKYSLNPNYASIFLDNLWVENSPEAIFEIEYSNFGNIRNSDRVRMYTPGNGTFNPGFNTFGWVRPNKEIFDQHRTQYPNDPRIAATFIFGSYPRPTPPGGVQNIYPTTPNGSNGFAVIRKWFDKSYNGTTTSKNFLLLRYSDVLLMMAEIENELNGPNNAYQYVNQVLLRARNSITPIAAQPADWAAMTQDVFRNRIMKERQYELLSEGQDWFDARRRGYQYFLNNTIIPHNTNPTIRVGNSDFLYPTSSRAMLLPILNREILTNNAIGPEDQNPGY